MPAACSGAVPVFFAGWCPYGVAGAHSYDGAVAGDDQADAVGAVQGLAERVRVPVGPRAGGEADVPDDQARRFVGRLDLVDVDVPGEVLRRRFGGGADGLELQCGPLDQYQDGPWLVYGSSSVPVSSSVRVRSSAAAASGR